MVSSIFKLPSSYLSIDTEYKGQESFATPVMK